MKVNENCMKPFSPEIFGREWLGNGTAEGGKMQTLPSTKSETNRHLKVKVFKCEILSLGNKIPGETEIQEPKQNFFSQALISAQQREREISF